MSSLLQSGHGKTPRSTGGDNFIKTVQSFRRYFRY